MPSRRPQPADGTGSDPQNPPRFGARQPLCGIGVTSVIAVTSSPDASNAPDRSLAAGRRDHGEDLENLVRHRAQRGPSDLCSNVRWIPARGNDISYATLR